MEISSTDILIKFGVSPTDTQECLEMLLGAFIRESKFEDFELDYEMQHTQRKLSFHYDFSKFDTDSDWFNFSMVIVCIIGAALAAGLTMGFMSQDPIDLQIKILSGTETEKKQATKVTKLISNHHLLLVTLLLFNSLANEALPLFLNHLIPSYLAIIVSVSFVLFFGEIFPSAIFTGPRKLEFSALFAPFTQMLIAFFFIFSKPIAMVLDKFLIHEEAKFYNRDELAAFVSVQYNIGQNFVSHDDPLTEDEVAIVQGVFKTSTECVKDKMIPIERVFSLNSDTVLDENQMVGILRTGFSRIPIYQGVDHGNIRGYIIVKRLILLNPDDNRLVASLPLQQPLIVHPNLPLLQLLNQFQEGTHLAVVSQNPIQTIDNLRDNQPLTDDSRIIGIITLEDIIEELLQEEIEDERDKYRSRVEQHYLSVIKACLDKKAQERTSRRLIRPGFGHIQNNVPRAKDIEQIRNEKSSLINHEDFASKKMHRYDGQAV